MKRMIFHIPMKINRNRASASQIRPMKMIEAFKECGYEVAVVEGYGKERKRQIKEIKSNILKGVKYDFLYSESSTMPTLLTERNHLPLYPFLDFSFLAFCKKRGIKIGLFYRDIYWCFDKEAKNWKQKIADYFYRYDLKEYRRLVDVFFLPSKAMLKYIPFHFSNKVEELPPGGELRNYIERESHDVVNLLYIGGIGNHYDLKMIVTAITKVPKVKLTICCRKDDWEAVKEEYLSILSDQIEIVHKFGKELEDLYYQADLFCLFVEPQEYRNFAVPFKLFETIGFGCPILASEGTWVSRFVKSNKIGFTCKYDMVEIVRMLQEIVNDRNELLFCSSNIRKVAIENTWEARCHKIVMVLRDSVS